MSHDTVAENVKLICEILLVSQLCVCSLLREALPAAVWRRMASLRSTEGFGFQWLMTYFDFLTADDVLKRQSFYYKKSALLPK